MSTESSKAISRQWHIIQFLLDGRYASTSCIREHLLSVGVEAELRTIQRDLHMLGKILPIECRRDSTPHSWRWKSMDSTHPCGLRLSQVLALRLVEEELKDVIAAPLLADLQPLFIRARLILGMTQGQELLTALHRLSTPHDSTSFASLFAKQHA